MAPVTALSQDRTASAGRYAGETSFSREMAEQLVPLVALRNDLARSWPMTVDVYLAHRQMKEGRAGYDPFAAIVATGELGGAFRRAIGALEGAGLATNWETTAVRGRRFRLLSLISGWLTGEPAPEDEVKRAARTAAMIVGSSILMAASRSVLRGWEELPKWSAASCPCCGSPADLAVTGAAGRTLVCSKCDTPWGARTSGCPGCGETEAPELVRFDVPSIGFTLAMCNPCGRYLKEPHGTGLVEPLVARTLTQELDAVAEARGLRV